MIDDARHSPAGAGPAGAAHGPDLDAALAAIGEADAIAFRAPGTWNGVRSTADRVEAIALASRVRARRVRLSGSWWRGNVGSLLALGRGDGRPIALLCARRRAGLSRSYELVDPRRGTRRPFRPDDARGLSPMAYSFVRPLPDRIGRRPLARLSRFALGPHRAEIAIVTALALVLAACSLAAPVVALVLIDGVSGARGVGDPLAIVAASFAVILCLKAMTFVVSYTHGSYLLAVKSLLAAQLQGSIVDRLFRLPVGFFRRFESGDLLRRSLMISEVGTILPTAVMTGVLALASALVMLAFCAYLSPPLAGLALATSVATAASSAAFAIPIRRRSLRMELQGGAQFGDVVQVIHGAAKIRCAAAEPRAYRRWSTRYADLLRQRHSIQRLRQGSELTTALIQSLSGLLLFGGAALVCVSSSSFPGRGDPFSGAFMTAGTFFAIQAAFGGISGGVGRFFQIFVELSEMSVKRELIRPILDQPPEGGDGVVEAGALAGEVALEDVVFRYRDDGPAVLDGVSLEVRSGEFVAIVGPTASGKSTLLRLLLGFETPESGRVAYDGVDLSGLDAGSVRRQLGVVLQDGKVSARTIHEAIAGARRIGTERAWSAAEDACIADDIRRMPMGLQTLLSEGATTLSEGQRQRLLIARALAADPKVLILDEATSALDNPTQAAVTAGLERRRVTRIVVAQRLSTIRGADRIYMLERGRVVESGSFDQLMAAGGPFSRLARLQEC